MKINIPSINGDAGLENSIVHDEVNQRDHIKYNI